MENIDENLQKNIDNINKQLENCQDIVTKNFFIGKEEKIELFMIYVDNLIRNTSTEEALLTNLMNRVELLSSNKTQLLTKIRKEFIAIGDVKEVYTFSDIFDCIFSGDTVLLMDSNSYALVVSMRGFATRGVPKAETEVVVEGPKDAFNEAINTNIVLIRRRIRDTKMKLIRKRVGRRSKTDLALIYMEDIVRDDILSEALKSLEDLDIDAIFDSGNLEQLIEKKSISPFPQMQLTERPDKASSAILEGRIVIICDNTPFALIIPATLNVFLQSAEDYYDRFFIMSFLRVLRYVSTFIAVCLPAFFVAVSTFHPSMIPTSLALKIAETRSNVPFPCLVEILMIEFAFELLREAGVRLPAPVGSSIGIVGGIIIGQSAVEAGLISPLVVIVSALTGICTFVIPNYSFVSGIRVSKYLLILLAGFLGMYGFWIGALIILIHLASLQSFGIPYLYPFCSSSINNFSDVKDSIFRIPIPLMKKRPIFAKDTQRVRMKESGERK